MCVCTLYYCYYLLYSAIYYALITSKLDVTKICHYRFLENVLGYCRSFNVREHVRPCLTIANLTPVC